MAGKDPGDMLAAGVNIRTWVEAGLTEYKDVAAQPEQPVHLADAEEELVVNEHHEPAPPPTSATCESCPWYELNPWTHDPALGAWCHRRMEPLATGSPACEEFRRGRSPPGNPTNMFLRSRQPGPQLLRSTQPPAANATTSRPTMDRTRGKGGGGV